MVGGHERRVVGDVLDRQFGGVEKRRHHTELGQPLANRFRLLTDLGDGATELFGDGERVTRPFQFLLNCGDEHFRYHPHPAEDGRVPGHCCGRYVLGLRGRQIGGRPEHQGRRGGDHLGFLHAILPLD